MGNIRAENYQEVIDNMLRAYKHMGFYVIENTFRTFPPGPFFPPNLWAVSNEHGKRFTRTHLSWKKDTGSNGHPAC